jgi:ABC-type nitrate/sulfonate/bicarbonate transport system substrate-binding protein
LHLVRSLVCIAAVRRATWLRARRIVAALALALLALAPQLARAQSSVVLAMQPGTFAGLPFALAEQQGWWRDAGLAPATISFAAPTPLLMAATAGAWDIGVVTTVPAIAGAARSELQAVAVVSDDAGATVLLAPRNAAPRIRGALMLVDGWQLLAPVTSAAGYTAESCLRWLGIAPQALRSVDLMPADVLARFAGAQPALAALNPPQTWQLQAAGAATVCSARDAGIGLPAFVVVRRDFARDHPDVVRRVVAVVLRALAYIAARPPDLPQTMRRFYAGAGVPLDDAGLRAELDTRTLFDAAAQRRLYDRSSGRSTLDRWIDGVAGYLLRQGFPDVPGGRQFLTGAFLPADDALPPAPPRRR